METAGYDVKPFSPPFDQHTLDVEWFPYVADRGWIALSKNWKQRYVSDERDVAMRSGLALFHLIKCGSHTTFAPILVRLIPKIISWRESHEPPFMAKVYRHGQVRHSLSYEEWIRMPGVVP